MLQQQHLWWVAFTFSSAYLLCLRGIFLVFKGEVVEVGVEKGLPWRALTRLIRFWRDVTSFRNQSHLVIIIAVCHAQIHELQFCMWLFGVKISSESESLNQYLVNLYDYQENNIPWIMWFCHYVNHGEHYYLWRSLRFWRTYQPRRRNTQSWTSSGVLHRTCLRNPHNSHPAACACNRRNWRTHPVRRNHCCTDTPGRLSRHRNLSMDRIRLRDHGNMMGRYLRLYKKEELSIILRISERFRLLMKSIRISIKKCRFFSTWLTYWKMNWWFQVSLMAARLIRFWRVMMSFRNQKQLYNHCRVPCTNTWNHSKLCHKTNDSSSTPVIRSGPFMYPMQNPLGSPILSDEFYVFWKRSRYKFLIGSWNLDLAPEAKRYRI